MAKCPQNSFKECYGSECEWYIADKGLCSITCIAQSTGDISVLPLAVLFYFPSPTPVSSLFLGLSAIVSTIPSK